MQFFMHASNGITLQVSQTIIKLKEANLFEKWSAFVLYINKLELFENFISKKGFKHLFNSHILIELVELY